MNPRSAQTARRPDPSAVLTKAFLNAGQGLGMTREQLGRVVGRNRTSLHRGLAADSKAGELALMLIRCYRGLYALTGGDAKAMRHWMTTPNHHTGGQPLEQVQTVAGLARIVDYLDAMRGQA